ncbi:MAG TPA: biotin/lipoyl-containing protein [Acidimicrobiales bacterium]|nr:biotin/lipoyl-containing protein [Acidimicrobiales bacterium]
MNLSPEDVRDILKVLDSTDYDELQLETEHFVLRLRRGPGGWTEEHEVRGAPHLVTCPAGEEASSERAGEGGVGQGDQEGREGDHAVRAPLPGVFYRAPKPGEAPFVEVGDHVDPDTVVAILETMKLMNPVRAGTAGTVARFAVVNGEPAEQGAVLLWLTPDASKPGQQ